MGEYHFSPGKPSIFASMLGLLPTFLLILAYLYRGNIELVPLIFISLALYIHGSVFSPYSWSMDEHVLSVTSRYDTKKINIAEIKSVTYYSSLFGAQYGGAPAAYHLRIIHPRGRVILNYRRKEDAQALLGLLRSRLGPEKAGTLAVPAVGLTFFLILALSALLLAAGLYFLLYPLLGAWVWAVVVLLGALFFLLSGRNF